MLHVESLTELVFLLLHASTAPWFGSWADQEDALVHDSSMTERMLPRHHTIYIIGGIMGFAIGWFVYL